MNASFWEILQTLSAGLGALLTLRAMVGADLNLVAVKRSSFNGNRRIIAEKNVRVERCVLTVQLSLFFVGLATLFLAPPPYSPVPDGTVRHQLEMEMIRSVALTRLAMTLSSFALMYLSYRNWLDERLPIILSRRDDVVARNSQLAVVAQDAALHAEATASSAVETASAAAAAAVLAQDAVAEDAANDKKETS